MIRYTLHDTLAPAEVLILPFFEDTDLQKNIQALSTSAIESVLSVLETGDFSAQFGQIQFVYTGEKEIARIMLLGLGKKSESTERKNKMAFGSAVIALQSKKIKNAAILLDKTVFEVFGSYEFLRQLVVSIERSNYSYDEHKEKNTRVISLETVQLVVSSNFAKKEKEMRRGIDEGIIIGKSLNWARSLGDTPPSIMTPLLLGVEAQTIAQKNNKVKVKILSQKEIEKLQMGCFLGVAQGSIHEPKFIIVEYFGGKATEAPTVLVGKGITYDSGGLTLKSLESLLDMKYDMLGGASVLAIVRACSLLKLKKNIVALVPACENMPSGNAFRPDDILTAMNGKTVLIENTDAEGRLILADALCYAAKYKPKEVIDFATLTAHCCIALGNEYSGLFSKDEKISEKILKTSKKMGEQFWPLPLGDEFSEAVKSEVADLKNMGGVGHPRFGGASIAAAFLENFTSYPWAHVDMSCAYYGSKGKSWIRGGANGFAIETMIEYLRT